MPMNGPSRIASIDLLRGAVMILMAIDHVRVYSGIPAGGPTFDVFMTRWITHFCAPVFIFLAGTSAYLYAQKHADVRRFLVIRGAWLIILELTFLRVAWTFNFDFADYELAGVIWVIGWSMISLAAVARLPVGIVGAFGIAVIFGHNVLDSYVANLIPTLEDDFSSALWKLLYVGFFAGPVSIGPNGPNVMVLYSLFPWVGVMAAGYAFGRLVTLDQPQRDRTCYALGLGAIALFLVLRGLNVYGDPNPWESGESLSATFMRFLGVTKYPASLSFLLMTLGPAIALIPILDHVRGRLAEMVALFGRVPLFYYLAHIPLVHAMAAVVSLLRTGSVHDWLFANHPMGNPPPPPGYAWNLPTLYAVWAVAIAILYFACRWYERRKSQGDSRWLKYL